MRLSGLAERKADHIVLVHLTWQPRGNGFTHFGCGRQATRGRPNTRARVATETMEQKDSYDLRRAENNMEWKCHGRDEGTLEPRVYRAVGETWLARTAHQPIQNNTSETHRVLSCCWQSSYSHIPDSSMQTLFRKETTRIRYEN